MNYYLYFIFNHYIISETLIYDYGKEGENTTLPAQKNSLSRSANDPVIDSIGPGNHKGLPLR